MSNETDDGVVYLPAPPTGWWNRCQQRRYLWIFSVVIFILVELMVVAVHSTLVLSDRAHSIQTIHNKPPLRFHREDESSSETTTTKTKNTTKYFFTILQLADIHLGENAWEDWGPEQDRKTFGRYRAFYVPNNPI